MSGIFISRFLTLTLSGISLTLGKDGKLTGAPSTALVHYDVCPLWLEIAVSHLKTAKHAHDEMLCAWKGTSVREQGQTLERSFQTSMQAITASAIAIDGFYAAIQKKAEIDPSLIATWQKNETPRYAQVCETIRLAYQLKPKGFAVMRNAIKQIFRLRDRAVHPSNKMEEAVLHPDLDIGVERRLEMFRYGNAFPIVRTTVCMIDELARNGNAKNDKILEYSDNLGISTAPLRSEGILELPALAKTRASRSRPSDSMTSSQ